MRYQVKTIKDLISIISELNDGDRIGFVIYDEDKRIGENVFEYTFRFNTNHIKLHEIKRIE